MGQRFTSIFHRNEENVQEVAIANNSVYKWPPKIGNYFGSHFIMGGERFDSQQPEAFLFGENSDLNFLGNRPMPFPYPAPQLNEPTRTLRSLINIRKDTVRLVKLRDTPDEEESTEVVGAGGDSKEDSISTSKRMASPLPTDDVDVEAGNANPPADDAKYNVEFTFDSDVTCNISIVYFAKEDVVNGLATYTPQQASTSSETFTYKKGANQVFSQPAHMLDPSAFSDDEWSYSVDKEEIPIVIQCTVENEPETVGHSHITFCVLERLHDGYSIKAIKQKQCVDGLLYMLQEFYGIENKEDDKAKDDDDKFDDNTAECVICMCDIRDTLILPCRHLCLCNGCADSLRYQANNCPICRAPFRALLQLRAVRRKGSKPEGETATNGSDEEDDLGISQKGVPTGFEAISLIEALNGPCFYSNKSSDPKQQPRVLLSHGSLRRSKKNKKKDNKGSKIGLKDKNKDKDDIADEEKARDAEQQSEFKDNEVNETQAKESTTEAEKEEKTSEEKTDNETSGESQIASAVDDMDQKKDEKAEIPEEEEKPEKEEENPNAESAFDKTNTPSGDNETTGTRSVASGKISEFEEDGEASDTLTLSMVSQTTTLPGTPDHVIEDDEMVAEQSL